MSTAEAGSVPALTPAGLTAVLRGEGHDVEVTALDVEPVGTGQMGSSYRLTPTCTGPGAAGLPATLVAKVPGPDAATKAAVGGAYRTEVGFYRDLAASLAVRVPRCWHASVADDGVEFLLLLDDLAPAVPGDQIAGCPPAAAHAAVANLAGLHGPRWCDRSLATDGGLSVVDEAQAATLGAVTGPVTDMFLARFAGRLPPDDVEVLRAVPPVIGAWVQGRSERFAPVHGDYRLDNLMFDPDGTTVTALDWQTVSLGLPARDLAYFLATSLTVADRRAHEDEVVATYHRALQGHGVRVDPATVAEDYRYGLLQAPLIIVFGCAVGTPTERGDRMFLAMAERACAAIRDHDTLALVPSG